MRDVISGEYLLLTIEQFCNILPGDGDEMVAPSQAINWENSPIRNSPVRGEKGADPRHRNGLLIALLEKSIHKSNLARATTPDYGFGRVDNQWIRRKSSPVSQERPPSADEFRDTGIGFRGRAGGHGRSSWNRVQSRPWQFNPDAHRFTATRLH
ncbi:hypothetical protein G5I_14600 [Acromyrmex echinatior]|uniref:Uncharacterized protein n=1 Tax=Acromyrmex echinatior TaxID=103372 RepID=F4X8C0_ACREC|nr:hypothetical protein G5I_14600 [Acromyrmex echinatior]